MTPNIGPRGQRQRFVFGVTFSIVAIALTAALFILGAPRWSRAFVLLPLWLAGLGVFQAQAKT